MVSAFHSPTRTPALSRQPTVSSESSPASPTPKVWRLPPLAIAGFGLILVHVAVLAIFRHSPSLDAWSDFLELGAVLLATIACFATSRRAHGIARPFWYLNGSAFATWSAGKCIIVYRFEFLGIYRINFFSLILFFLAAAPMFVAIFLSDENFQDRISWEWALDAAQILGLILAIYLFLIYIPILYYGDWAVSGLEDRLLLWRNILLAAGLLARAALSQSRYTRRLYLPVGLIIGIYTVSTWFGNRAQSLSGGPVSAWYDLAWAVPFSFITIAAAFWQESPEPVAGQHPVPGISRVIIAYLPSLLLPIMLIMKYGNALREQVFIALFGLIFSIILFNARLLLTQRRQRLTDEALHATEQQYRSLFERNMAGVYRCTMDGRLLECNPAFAKIFGYTPEEVLTIPLHELYFGGASERDRWIAQFNSEGMSQPREFYFRRKDGSPLWVLVSSHIEKQPDGGSTIEGTLIDITAGKLTSLAIEDWKYRYDAAILASGQIVYESDPESQRVTFGGCVPDVLGYSAEDLSGDAHAWLALIHPEDLTHYLEQLRSAVASNAPIEFEYRARRRDNGYRTLREQGRAVRDAAGKVFRIVGFISDVTERRVLESQLQQAQKMEAVGRLAGGVAHDFNNLLTIISGYSAMQLERTQPTDATHREAEQIKAAAERASALTRQLLAFSRQQVMQPRCVNLNDVVRSIDPMLRRLIGEDIEVLTSLAPDLGNVKVDPGQVDQVLMNLVVNARDAMPEGGKLTIRTQNIQLDERYARQHDYVRPGSYVLLSVSDSGTGIAPETQERVFEPFFTTKGPGKGTGLGLPMVYGIVKQSGGSIEFYSELKQGTIFKVYLPRVEEAAEDLTPAVEAAPSHRGSERILLVEDDVVLRQLAAVVLTAQGYSVHTVEKVSDLAACLDRTPQCDLLLTDVIMPGMKGPELASRVVQHWPGIKVLYMSGYTSDAIVHHGVLNEGLFFLQKPFTPTALAAKVKEVLNAASPGRSAGKSPIVVKAQSAGKLHAD